MLCACAAVVAMASQAPPKLDSSTHENKPSNKLIESPLPTICCHVCILRPLGSLPPVLTCEDLYQRCVKYMHENKCAYRVTTSQHFAVMLVCLYSMSLGLIANWQVVS